MRLEGEEKLGGDWALEGAKEQNLFILFVHMRISLFIIRILKWSIYL